MEENSISIISRNNGQLTGEKAQALSVKLTGGFSWVKIFLAGVVITFLILAAAIYFAKKQVVVVEVSGKSDQFQLLELK